LGGEPVTIWKTKLTGKKAEGRAGSLQTKNGQTFVVCGDGFLLELVEKEKKS
jgi:hypothetical protein